MDVFYLVLATAVYALSALIVRGLGALERLS